MRIYWNNGGLIFEGETKEETNVLLSFNEMLKSDTLKVGKEAHEANRQDRLKTFPKHIQDKFKDPI